jgi:hypothetical protein
MIHWDWIKTYFVASAIELGAFWVVRDHLRRVPLGWQTVAPDQDTCNHVWILDKTSEVVRLICAKCGKVMNP